MPIACVQSEKKVKIPEGALEMCVKAEKDSVEVLDRAHKIMKKDSNITDRELNLLRKYYFIGEGDVDFVERAAAIRKSIKQTKIGISGSPIALSRLTLGTSIGRRE